MPASVRITSAERRWLIGVALIVLGLASLPYLVGALAAGPDRVFTGLQVNPLDGVSYLAKMRLGYNGELAVSTCSSRPKQGQGVFLFTYFIALGHLARILGLPLIVVFHLARLIGGFALLWMIYELIARVTDAIDLRRRAWWIVALSSGVGWLAALLGHGDSSDHDDPRIKHVLQPDRQRALCAGRRDHDRDVHPDSGDALVLDRAVIAADGSVVGAGDHSTVCAGRGV